MLAPRFDKDEGQSSITKTFVFNLVVGTNISAHNKFADNSLDNDDAV